MSQERENLKAGLFVLAGTVLALIIVFVLADIDQIFEQQKEVQVYYQLRDGLQGLKQGAPVTLGDQPVGEVTGIEDVTERDAAGNDRVIGKLVIASIPNRYTIFQNAVIELKAPLIGSGTSLNVRSVGQGMSYAGTDPITGTVAGSAQVQELVREAGITEKQRQQIRDIIANVESITATLRQDIPSIAVSAKEIMADAKAASNDLKEIITETRRFVADIQDRREAWLGRIDNVTASADQAMGDIRDFISDEDPLLRQAVENVHDVTQTIREKTVAQVTVAMDKAIAAVDHFQTTAQEIKAFVVGQRPVLQRTLANARLTSDQLKLTAIEVRRAPWRLLYDPDDSELDSDNLYDAARSFALAAGTLDTAADSLRDLVDKQAVDDQQLTQMLRHLEAVFSTFKDAEAAFWKQMKVRPAAASP